MSVRPRGIGGEDLDALDDVDEFDIPTPGDPEEEESARLLAEFTGPDEDPDAEPSEDGEVDEFSLLERMPEELRPQLVKLVKQLRASTTASQRDQTTSTDDQESMGELLRYLRGTATERPALPAPEENQRSAADTRYELPAEFGALEPYITGIKAEQTALARTVESKLNQLLARLDGLERSTKQEKFHAEFGAIKKDYGKLYPKLAPRVSEQLKETPELALSPSGIRRAFKTAKTELELEAALSELRGARRAGVMPRSTNGGRINGRTAPAGLNGGAKNSVEAARFAIKQMREMGIAIPDV